MSHSTLIRGKSSMVLTALTTALLLGWPPGLSVAAEPASRLQDAADIPQAHDLLRPRNGRYRAG